MPRHPLRDAIRRIGMSHFAGDEQVEANDVLVIQRDIGPRRVRRLSLERMTEQEAVEGGMAAREAFDDVVTFQGLDAKARHGSSSVPRSNTEGSRKRR